MFLETMNPVAASYSITDVTSTGELQPPPTFRHVYILHLLVGTAEELVIIS